MDLPRPALHRRLENHALPHRNNTQTPTQQTQLLTIRDLKTQGRVFLGAEGIGGRGRGGDQSGLRGRRDGEPGGGVQNGGSRGAQRGGTLGLGGLRGADGRAARDGEAGGEGGGVS